MTVLQGRFTGIVDRLGETFVISGGSHKGVFGILSPAVAARYVSGSVIDAAARPIRSVYVAHDDTAAVGNSAVWEGGTYTVQKVIPIRFRGETVAKLLVFTQ